MLRTVLLPSSVTAGLVLLVALATRGSPDALVEQPTAFTGSAPVGTRAGAPDSADPQLLASSEQQLVAVVENPGDRSGRLHRFERRAGAWRDAGPAIPVVVGRNGVGPKREGDGRSPQGVFSLGPAFGYRESAPSGTGIPYRPLRPGTVCVDDPASSRYDRIVDAGADRDWDSAEAMRRDLVYGDDLYSLGVMVDYNPDHTPGAGSCIFLHVWRSPDSPTAGCTAMSERDLRTLLSWLDPDRLPILVQGTRAYLESLREEGLLPYPVPPPPEGARPR